MENVIFLEEWIIYHHLKGVTHFFLYDNTGSTRGSPYNLNNPHLKLGTVNKYGIPYDDLVLMSQAEVDVVIARIQSDFPDVHIHRWTPRDENGQIVYGHVKAKNDALTRFGGMVDWMIFMDMDEFLVSDETIPEICHWLGTRGFDGGLMVERVMASRYDHIDRYVLDNNMAYRRPTITIPKYICRPDAVQHAETHKFRSMGIRIVFDARRLHFLHYKMPSLHPDMTDDFVAVDTGIHPSLLDAYKESAAMGCDPEWRSTVVNPDWRSLMTQVLPSWHVEIAKERLRDRNQAIRFGRKVALAGRTLMPPVDD